MRFVPGFKVIVSEKQRLREKIRNMEADGLENLQILSDFDWTFTLFHTDDNMRMATDSFLIFRENREVVPDLSDAMRVFISDHTLAEKAVAYSDIFMKIMENDLKQIELTNEMCQKILSETEMKLRNGVDKVMQFSSEQNLPFYILSGGISQMISGILSDYRENYDNLFIFANDLVFSDGKFDRIKRNVNPFEKHKFFEGKDLEFRRNLIVCGDSESDATMSYPIKSAKNVIKIGYLRPGASKQKEERYKEIYDIVIQGDGDFQVQDYLLRRIAGLDTSLHSLRKMQEYEELIELMEL